MEALRELQERSKSFFTALPDKIKEETERQLERGDEYGNEPRRKKARATATRKIKADIFTDEGLMEHLKAQLSEVEQDSAGITNIEPTEDWDTIADMIKRGIKRLGSLKTGILRHSFRLGQWITLSRSRFRQRGDTSCTWKEWIEKEIAGFVRVLENLEST